MFAASCKKEGCTDIAAINYDSEAEKNDNTCNYEASVIFWVNASSSVNFQNNMINSLNIYVNGAKIGQMSTSSDQLTTPACNSVGVTHLLDLASATSTSITYKVTYDGISGPNTTTEYTHAEGTLQLEGGKCTAFLIQ